MTRDYSQIQTGAATPSLSFLQRLGWQDFLAAQTDIDTIASHPPVRVTEVHRSGLIAIGDGIEVELPPNESITAGDWLLYDAERPMDSVLLDRKSLLKRRAPGRDHKVQMIAANIDTAFIVSSCNADFNIARLERYVALVMEAGVTPVILLTKPDLAEDPERYVAEARGISDRVEVIALNAKSDEVPNILADWAKPGQTIAFLGSSGVGKSTLTNVIAGTEALTQGIREDDARGRHTTRHRQLHLSANGPLVLDTPGMRELQLTDVASGLSELFEDIETLATQCKFRNCEHEGEPGCAVGAAIADGTLDAGRLTRWRKLTAEEELNTATAYEKREKARTTAKLHKSIKSAKKTRR